MLDPSDNQPETTNSPHQSPSESTTDIPPRNGRRAAVPLILLLTGLIGGGVIVRIRSHVDVISPPIVDLDESNAGVKAVIESGRRAVDADSRSANSWGEYGMLLYAHGFAPQALDCFTQAERLDGGDYRWPYLSGLCVTFTDPERGLDCFLRASRLRPDLPYVRLRTAELLIDFHRADQARPHVDDVLVREPDNPRALLAAARLALLNSDLAESRSYAARCIEHAPGTVAALEFLARVCFQQGDMEAAREYQRLLQRSQQTMTDWPDPLLIHVMGLRRDEHWLLFRIQEQLNSGATDEAILALEQALAAFPESIEFRIELVRTYSTIDRVEEALRIVEVGIRLNPDSARLCRFAGLLHARQGDNEMAVRNFRQAIALKPDYALGHFSFGEYLLNRGDDEEALAELEAAAVLQPDLPGLTESLQELRGRVP